MLDGNSQGIIKYNLQFPVGSGITAWDLAEAGEISWTDFGVYATLHRNSAWGYAGKVTKRSWKQWQDLMHLSEAWIRKCVDRLAEMGLIYKYPNKRGVTPRFVIFKEALQPDEIQHYLDIFEQNPAYTYIKDKTHHLDHIEIPNQPTTEESATKPAKAKYVLGQYQHGDDLFFCDGRYFSRKRGSYTTAIEFEDLPIDVQGYFSTNGVHNAIAS